MKIQEKNEKLMTDKENCMARNTKKDSSGHCRMITQGMTMEDKPVFILFVV